MSDLNYLRLLRLNAHFVYTANYWRRIVWFMDREGFARDDPVYRLSVTLRDTAVRGAVATNELLRPHQARGFRKASNAGNKRRALALDRQQRCED